MRVFYVFENIFFMTSFDVIRLWQFFYYEGRMTSKDVIAVMTWPFDFTYNKSFMHTYISQNFYYFTKNYIRPWGCIHIFEPH